MKQTKTKKRQARIIIVNDFAKFCVNCYQGFKFEKILIKGKKYLSSDIQILINMDTFLSEKGSWKQTKFFIVRHQMLLLLSLFFDAT